jgi:hypothetical protein
LHGRETRLAIDETLVAGFQAGQRFVGRAYWYSNVIVHDAKLSVVVRWKRRGMAVCSTPA